MVQLRNLNTPHGERTQLRKEVEKLKFEMQLQRDEIKSLKSEARSYQDELRQLQSQVATMEKQALQARSYQDELEKLQNELPAMKQQALQETLAAEIGKQVRLRYLEQHRYRMNRGIGKIGHERIKCGDRAAHRGRPVIDALICLTGLMTDPKVYEDLYGVTPEQMLHLKDVPDIIDIASFHASLQSEGRMTNDFKTLFKRLSEVAKTYASPTQLREAFKEGSKDKILHQLQAELQDRYDKIVATNPRGQQRGLSDATPPAMRS